MKAPERDRETANLLRWLANHGCPVDISPIDSEIKIETRDPTLTQMFDLGAWTSGYMLDVRITNLTTKQIFVEEISLGLPWEDNHFAWLPDPLASDARGNGVYVFPTEFGPEFPRDVVLNHLLLNGATLAPNRWIQGLLLGTGSPLPAGLSQQGAVDGTLKIRINGDWENSSIIRFGVDRSMAKAPRKPQSLLYSSRTTSSPVTEHSARAANVDSNIAGSGSGDSKNRDSRLPKYKL